MSALACSGELHLAVLADNGGFAGFLDIINTVKLELTAQGGQEIVQIDNSHANYGQARSSFIVPAQTKLNLSFDDQGDAALVETHLLGERSVLTQAGGAFSDEPVVAYLDRWVPIGTLRNLKTASPAISVTDDPNTQTYAVDDDYIINPITGLLKALSGGAITDGQALLVTGETKAIDGARIAGGRRKFLRSRIFFDGINLFTGNRIQIQIQQVDLTPTNGMNFMQKAVGNSDFTGTPLALPGQDPFVIDEFAVV